jgi:prepilin-type N-terminal cleavage/methylation domain-containing protein
MRNRRGFTLIELLVALVIAGVLVVITVPGFVHFRSSLVRNQVRWGLIADLRYARQLAVTKHRQVVVAFGNGSATTNLTTYTLHTDTNANFVKDAGEPVLNRTLPRGAFLTSVVLTPTDSVVFDNSGALRTPSLGGLPGGQLMFQGPQGFVDTLNVSAIGMVYHP